MDLRLLNKLREELRSRLQDGFKHEQLPRWLENSTSMEDAEERCLDHLVDQLADMAMKQNGGPCIY